MEFRRRLSYQKVYNIEVIVLPFCECVFDHAVVSGGASQCHDVVIAVPLDNSIQVIDICIFCGCG